MVRRFVVQVAREDPDTGVETYLNVHVTVSGFHMPATRTDPECWPEIEIEDEDRFTPEELDFIREEAARE